MTVRNANEAGKRSASRGGSRSLSFWRTEASRGRADEVMIAVGGVGERSPNVLQSKFGKLFDDLVVGHAGGQPAEDVVNGDAHPADARPAAAFARFNGDDPR